MKVLVSDYDRTLYLNDDDIKINKEYIDKFRINNKFVIASGRSYQYFLEGVNKTKIKYDYALVDHGSIIIDKDNKIIKSFFIKDELVNNIKDDLDLSNAENFFCCSLKEVYVPFDHPNITKINVKYKDSNIREEMYNSIYKKYGKDLNIYRVSKQSIEIVPKEASKYLGIKYLIEKLNIDKKDVYTIGDDYTDIEMVKSFNGACMENSIKDLVKVSKGKYSSVYKFIEQILK